MPPCVNKNGSLQQGLSLVLTNTKSCCRLNDSKFVRGCASIVSPIFSLHFSYVEYALLLSASSLRQRQRRSRPVDCRGGHTGGAAFQRRVSPQYEVDGISGDLRERRRDCKIHRDYCSLIDLLSTISKKAAPPCIFMLAVLLYGNAMFFFGNKCGRIPMSD